MIGYACIHEVLRDTVIDSKKKKQLLQIIQDSSPVSSCEDSRPAGIILWR